MQCPGQRAADSGEGLWRAETQLREKQILSKSHSVFGIVNEDDEAAAQHSSIFCYVFSFMFFSRSKRISFEDWCWWWPGHGVLHLYGGHSALERIEPYESASVGIDWRMLACACVRKGFDFKGHTDQKTQLLRASTSWSISKHFPCFERFLESLVVRLCVRPASTTSIRSGGLMVRHSPSCWSPYKTYKSSWLCLALSTGPSPSISAESLGHCNPLHRVSLSSKSPCELNFSTPFPSRNASWPGARTMILALKPVGTAPLWERACLGDFGSKFFVIYLVRMDRIGTAVVLARDEVRVPLGRLPNVPAASWETGWPGTFAAVISSSDVWVMSVMSQSCLLILGCWWVSDGLLMGCWW